MTQKARHGQSRVWRGEAEAKPLLDWLNRASMATSRTIAIQKKLAEVGQDDDLTRVELLSQFKSANVIQMGLARVLLIKKEIESLQAKIAEQRPRKSWKEKPKWLRDGEIALNMRLHDYQFVYGVDYSSSSALAWVLQSLEDPAETGYVAGETLAIHYVVELAKQKRLSNVRVCGCGCGRFFFSRIPSGRWYSPQCHDRYWESQPERRQRKREKRKEYYQLHKTRIFKGGK